MTKAELEKLVRQIHNGEIEVEELTDEESEEVLGFLNDAREVLNEELWQTIDDSYELLSGNAIRELTPYEHLIKEYQKQMKGIKLADAKKKAYFWINTIRSNRKEYHEIIVFWSFMEILEFIRNEYSGTDNEMVLDYSFDQLSLGLEITSEQRKDSVKIENYVQLVHGYNLGVLYGKLNDVVLDDGEISLAELMEEAKTEDEINHIIDMFNDEQNIIW